MEKKIILTILFINTLVAAQTQPAFDKKLKSLYRNTVPTITCDVLQDYISTNKKIVLLDTRTKEEYEISHLPNSVFIDYKKFSDKDLALIDKNSTIVVYCSVGYRSERIGERMKKLGFKNVNNLYGGIFKWKNEGRVVVNSNNLKTDSVHTYNKSWSQWLTKGIKVY